MSRLRLNNSNDIIANSIQLIDGNELNNIFDVFLKKTEEADIVGIAPDTLNTLQEIANSIDNDPDFFKTIDNKINLKRDITDSYSKSEINNTKDQTNILINTKLNASEIYNYYDKIQTQGFLNLQSKYYRCAYKITKY